MSKTAKKKSISFFLGLVFLLLGFGIFFFSPLKQIVLPSKDAPEPLQRVAFSEQSDESEGMVPVRIKIPRLGIDAFVEESGVGENGHMQVPSNYENTGWYKHGFRPGEEGNAVIAGHLDNSLGLAGVFYSLAELEAGDLIEVEDQNGDSLTFVVRDKELYDYLDAPMERIFGPASAAQLNLITCDGAWVDEVRSYDKRLVVFTELIS